MENIAFDSHKRYTFCSVENADGVIVEEGRIDHVRGAIGRFLERFTPGSPVAVETIGNRYRIILDIDQERGVSGPQSTASFANGDISACAS
jgi:hypothetical protein